MKASELIRQLTNAMGGQNKDFDVICVDSFTGNGFLPMDTEFIFSEDTDFTEEDCIVIKMAQRCT